MTAKGISLPNLTCAHCKRSARDCSCWLEIFSVTDFSCEQTTLEQALSE